MKNTFGAEASNFTGRAILRAHASAQSPRRAHAQSMHTRCTVNAYIVYLVCIDTRCTVNAYIVPRKCEEDA